jgi:hypothetical protein
MRSFVEPAEWEPKLFETYSSESPEYVKLKYSDTDPIDNPHKFNIYHVSDKPIEGAGVNNIFPVLNNQKKYLISTASKAISHNIQQDIPSIVAYAKKYSNMLAVIYEPEYAGMKLAISKYLDAKKIEYIFVPIDACLHINNFFYVKNFMSTLPSIRHSIEFIESIANSSIEKVAHKKVYVSRTKTRKKWYFENGNRIILDQRIDNEVILENFFKSHGYEIVWPENFSDLYEQINFFRDVKVLVGLSGGGLTNHMFMQNNQTVIELATTIKPGYVEGVSTEETRSYHMEYIAMSYLKNHNYIVVPHDETVSNILDKFVNSPALKSFLN